MSHQNNAVDIRDAVSGPFFSVIMPVYNAGAYLRESLDSILAQDFRDWEAILVDDASSDESVAIAREYTRKDSRIKLFTSDRNSGAAHVPRLRAASLAAAPYVVTVDADDKVSPDLFSSLHRRIAEGDHDLVIPQLWRWKSASTHMILPAASIDTTHTWKGKDLVARTLVNWEIPLCGFAARRDIYIQADTRLYGLDRKSIFADELHSRRLLSLCNDVAFCEGRYYYRDNDRSITHVNTPRISQSRMDCCDALIAMAGDTFGTDSPTYYRALENKLYSAVGLLRMINDSPDLEPSQKRSVLRSVSSAMKGLDLSLLRGKTSPRYLMLMRLPASLARLSLKILDPFIYRKNGSR